MAGYDGALRKPKPSIRERLAATEQLLDGMTDAAGEISEAVTALPWYRRWLFPMRYAPPLPAGTPPPDPREPRWLWAGHVTVRAGFGLVDRLRLLCTGRVVVGVTIFTDDPPPLQMRSTSAVHVEPPNFLVPKGQRWKARDLR